MKKIIYSILFAVVVSVSFNSCKTAANDNQNTEHEHTYSTSWSSDECYHWYAATCEHTEEVANKNKHTFGRWITTKDATETEDGEKERVCSVCGDKITKKILRLGSDGNEDSYLSKYKVGDIILKDGSICHVEDYDIRNATAAAVIVRADTEDVPALGMGLYSGSGLKWCINTADCYNIKIGELQGVENSGLVDGRNAWNLLKNYCPDAKEHPEYYPAWNYCLTYGDTHGLYDEMANDWYLPTITELSCIFGNKDLIFWSLRIAGEYTSINDFISGAGVGVSSNQCYINNNYMHCLRGGEMVCSQKDNVEYASGLKHYVLPVKEFY